MIKNTKVTKNKKEKGPMERNEKINSRISKKKSLETFQRYLKIAHCDKKADL